MSLAELKYIHDSMLDIIDIKKIDSILNGDVGKIMSSSPHDIKLVSDMKIDQYLRHVLKKNFQFSILSEENRESWELNQGISWIIDPLDGSFNYLKRIPYYTVSIALAVDGQPVLGYIYDICRGDVYTGYKNGGVFKNGVILEKPKQTLPQDSLMTTGFPTYLVEENDINLFWSELKDYQKKYKKIRMLGCASCSLLMVINGESKRYHERNIAFWDVAPALLMCRELGLAVKENFIPSLFSNVIVDNTAI
jgi:myo-inositol-1(or 4)-monophosphatase